MNRAVLVCLGTVLLAALPASSQHQEPEKALTNSTGMKLGWATPLSCAMSANSASPSLR